MAKSGDWSASADVLGQFFYIILILAIVVLIFLIFARWFSAMRYGRGKVIRIIESCGVAPQSSVQIIQAGGKAFLIGVTKDQISILAELDLEESERANHPRPNRLRKAWLKTGVMPNTGIFDQYLKRFMSKAETDTKEDGS